MPFHAASNKLEEECLHRCSQARILRCATSLKMYCTEMKAGVLQDQRLITMLLAKETDYSSSCTIKRSID